MAFGPCGFDSRPRHSHALRIVRLGDAAATMTGLPRVTVLLVVALAAGLWIAPAHAGPAPWCGGNDRTSANRAPDLQLSPSLIRVVYATPADGPDNFAADAPLIVSDVGAIDAWWRGQDPTRTPRFDLFPFPGCEPGFGQLDLAFVRLPQPAAAYQGGNGFNALEGDLSGSVAHDVKQLVYYDGSNGDGNVCGQSPVLPDQGGPFASSVVYLQACDPDLGDAGQTARTAAHELTHNLGAEPDVGPPNACKDPANAGHPCDSSADILYPTVRTGETLATAVLDVNRDDYYGHSGSWWDVRNSDWLEHLPQLPLTVSVSGTGGSVFSSPPELSCSSSCTVGVDSGVTVTLGATPAAGSRVVGWSGACTGAGVCAFTMSAAATVTALFGPASYRLTIAVSGRGKVTGAGVSCPGRCQGAVDGGGKAQLKAVAAQGYRFAGWGGDCRGAGACTLRGDREHRVTARFVRR